MKKNVITLMGMAALVPLFALSLAACASQGSSVAGQTSAGLPVPDQASVLRAAVRNQADWSLPLDPYKLSDPHLNTYAEHLAAQPCLAEHGLVLNVPWQDPGESLSATMNGTGQRLFTPQIARKWGYHSAQMDSVSRTLWDRYLRSYRDLDRNEDFNMKFSNCIEGVRADNPLPDMDDQTFVFGLSMQARDDATQAPPVLEAAARWSQCMVTSGASDVPASPEQMPTLKMAEKFGLGADPAKSSSDVVISEEEIDLATLQADCENTSGYRSALYTAQWDLEQQKLTNDAERLHGIGTDVARYHDGVEALIDELAPPAP